MHVFVCLNVEFLFIYLSIYFIETKQRTFQDAWTFIPSVEWVKGGENQESISDTQCSKHVLKKKSAVTFPFIFIANLNSTIISSK